jgi:hypothetical protein
LSGTKDPFVERREQWGLDFVALRVSPAVDHLYLVTSRVDVWPHRRRRYDGVTVHWYLYEPAAPFTDDDYGRVLKDYQPGDGYAQSVAYDYLTREQVDALVPYLERFPGTVTITPVPLPVDTEGRVGVAAVPIGGDTDIYQLYEHEDYPLADKIAGYYCVAGCSLTALEYVVTWSAGNGLYRRVCFACGDRMDKDTVIAELYDRRTVAREGQAPRPGHPVCDACVEAGPEGIVRRARAQAEELEAQARDLRAARWTLPPLKEAHRLRAEQAQRWDEDVELHGQTLQLARDRLADARLALDLEDADARSLT